MEIVLLALVALTGVPLLYVIVQYNGLVGLRNQIQEAWSNIDTELKRRYNLIPNLVETVRGYSRHEQEVLERVTALRAQCVANHGAPSQQAFTENQLADALRQMLVVVEAYPDLKADEGFLRLHRELVNTEDRIQAARRFFNGNVREYQTKRESFPSNLVAQHFGFGAEEFLTLDPVIRTAPTVSL